jgi:hypothetical protein
LLSAELSFERTVVPPVKPMEEHHDFQMYRNSTFDDRVDDRCGIGSNGNHQ